MATLMEMGFARHLQTTVAGWVSFAALPAALAVLVLAGHARRALVLFCVVYGMSNGILIIVRGTVPQLLFGRSNYGAIAGAHAGPALLAKAAGPLAIAVVVPKSTWA